MTGDSSALASPATRQHTMSSVMSEDAVPSEDPRNTVELLLERLTAWKHVVDTFDEYMSTTEKILRSQAKEYEKVLKTVQNPLKAGHHFDQNVGGIASLFENMRQNTQGIINSHLEAEKNVKGSILPVIDKLRKEIKHQSKELSSGAVKGAKEIEKARNTTQKHIEILGQNAAGFDSSGGRINSLEDPYVLRRGVLHRLSKQVMEENNQRQVLITLQSNFSQFEQHIVEVIQTSLASLTHCTNVQVQSHQEHYSDIMKTAQAIPLDFEWNGFVSRSGDLLVDPTTPDRSIDTITFPNQDHRATNSIIEGNLERKSRNKLSFAGFTTGYYVVTMSKFFHEFKDDDYIRRDPTPELSIYLPDAIISLTSGEKFTVKGKDVSKGLSSKLSGHSELQFKASSAEEAQKWVNALRSAMGNVNKTAGDLSEEVSKEEVKSSPSPPTYIEESSATIAEKETQKSVRSLCLDDKDSTNQDSDTIKPLSSHPVDNTIAKAGE
ncbi:Cytoskeletal signaling protein slm1 [Golovinomyces cichoracearum]|uniref:Cytoskeletal signaling protein slm1 n=1 Tax=Golovinomyces cichoracearum TaxID=62708 RepID=A0A420IN62_9PEZI|nr:Cytoskeletal signaling protein slm1 [Golovinomyces cichoracearum]